MSDPILEMRRVSKSFFSIKALRNVDLTVYPGEIHALMGENGAGKSTLMKILSGAYRPDPGGEIRIEGKPVRIDGPLGGRAAGISIIYQELSLAPNLSVAENIYLGRESRVPDCWTEAACAPASARCSSGSARISRRRPWWPICRWGNANWSRLPVRCTPDRRF